MSARRHRPRSHHALVLLLCSAALWLHGATAWAQSPADVAAARELFIEASELGKQGRWDEARERYARSLQLKRAPITMYSLGVAQKNSGHLVEALESFRAFLAEPATPATSPYEVPAQNAIAELEPRVARLLIRVAGDVPGSVVTIDGAVVPRAAMGVPRLLNPGDHVVTATAAGHVAARREVTLSEGAREAIELALEPAAEPDEPKPPHQATRAAEPDEAAFPVIPVTLMAGGGALIVTGVVVGLVGALESSDAPTSDGPEADAARTKALVGDIVAGTGIAAAGVGLVLLLIRDEPTDSALLPWASDGAAGLHFAF